MLYCFTVPILTLLILILLFSSHFSNKSIVHEHLKLGYLCWLSFWITDVKSGNKAHLILRAPRGFSARLETTFDSRGKAKTIRVTEPLDIRAKSKTFSNILSDSRSMWTRIDFVWCKRWTNNREAPFGYFWSQPCRVKKELVATSRLGFTI